ncbi:MAG: hypothetical protein M3R24_05205 [Chloroflexota bacterium]|nr:hypothetical protein [Chloroflexota bacterium]
MTRMKIAHVPPLGTRSAPAICSPAGDPVPDTQLGTGTEPVDGMGQDAERVSPRPAGQGGALGWRPAEVRKQTVR